MDLNDQTICAFLHEHYGIVGVLHALPGEHDKNYRVAAQDGKQYLLKLHAPMSELGEVDMQVAVLSHLQAQAPNLPISNPVKTQGGLEVLPFAKQSSCKARLLTWLPGEVWAKSGNKSSASLASLGKILGELDLKLESFQHPNAQRNYQWDIGTAHHLLPTVNLIEDSEKRAVVASVLQHFEQVMLPNLRPLPRQVIHNDANDYNVILDKHGHVSGLLDFGDMVETYRIVELAVAAAYGLIGTNDPVGAILPLVSAYHAVNPLLEDEIEWLFDLIKARYVISIAIATRQIRENPENTYLLVSQEAVWNELKRLQKENPRLATLRLRSACGFEPVKGGRKVEYWLEANAHLFHKIIRPQVSAPRVTVFDFSATGADARLATSAGGAAFDAYCDDKISNDESEYGIGRYGEKRVIYKGDAFQLAAPQQRRDIHIGIDVFALAGEPVHAPLPGRVAYLYDDAVAFGFGPTILLEHQTDEGIVFWTLYGHLTRALFNRLKVGQAIAAGEIFASFGARSENGEWPPHLHFQIVTDHLGLEGRMHGVGSDVSWDVWRAVSPDPSVFFGLQVECATPVARAKPEIVAKRLNLIGKSLSIAYSDEPLKIIGGEGCYLIDEKGKRWLDMVNNVCHVGHCHPRVVAAAQLQIGKLNTNSRYLNDTLVEYAERLTALFPEPLNVCFFVNSGSEANDLAIRLARTATGNHDLITVDHAYHGHVSSLIDVSPYKFNGKGGTGCPPHVRVVEMPDLYRGRFRYGDAQAGTKYAEDVARQISAMALEDKRPSLFFSEALLGTGGQLTLPSGYLSSAYAYVRAAGGLCLADEVQVGFGRVGSHMWAFETQEVVPDIVTLGKPIGNGHPMAAVITTRKIADAFANGMEYFNTFGGNPVSASIGLAVLNVIRDERLRNHCDAVGKQLMDGVKALAERHPLIGDVRGMGLFNGTEFVKSRKTLEPAAHELNTVIAAMKREHGILLSSEGPLHNVLKIKPPVVFNKLNCEQFLAALDDVLGRCSN